MKTEASDADKAAAMYAREYSNKVRELKEARAMLCRVKQRLEAYGRSGDIVFIGSLQLVKEIEATLATGGAA